MEEAREMAIIEGSKEAIDLNKFGKTAKKQQKMLRVFQLLSQGKTAKEISELTGIPIRTIQKYSVSPEMRNEIKNTQKIMIERTQSALDGFGSYEYVMEVARESIEVARGIMRNSMDDKVRLNAAVKLMEPMTRLLPQYAASNQMKSTITVEGQDSVGLLMMLKDISESLGLSKEESAAIPSYSIPSLVENTEEKE